MHAEWEAAVGQRRLRDVIWLPDFPESDLAQCSNYMVTVNAYHCTSVYATGKAKVKAAKALVLSAGIVFLAVLCWWNSEVLLQENKQEERKVVSPAS